jgi:hypothetical protein
LRNPQQFFDSQVFCSYEPWATPCSQSCDCEHQQHENTLCPLDDLRRDEPSITDLHMPHGHFFFGSRKQGPAGTVRRNPEERADSLFMCIARPNGRVSWILV